MVRTARESVWRTEEASVAGESPDRSKQRESSAEPTSGTGAPVPDPRDPRLAVSRDPAERNGTTDSATRILTIPPLDDPTRLREAVATWVTPGDRTPAAEPTDDSGERRDGEDSGGYGGGSRRGAAGDTGDSGRGAAHDTDGSGRAGDGDGGGSADTGDGGRSGQAAHGHLSGSGNAGDGDDEGVGGSGQTVTGGGGAGGSSRGAGGSGSTVTGGGGAGGSSQGADGSGRAVTEEPGAGRSSQDTDGSSPTVTGGGGAGRSSQGTDGSSPTVTGGQRASHSSQDADESGPTVTEGQRASDSGPAAGEGRGGPDGSGNAAGAGRTSGSVLASGAGSASGSAQVSEAAGTADGDVGGATQVLRTDGAANRFDSAAGTTAAPADSTGTPGSAGAREKAADAAGGSGVPRAPRTAPAGAQEAPEGALGAPEGAPAAVKTPETPKDGKPAGETNPAASVRETRAAGAAGDAEPVADRDAGSEAGRRTTPGTEPEPGAGKPTGTASKPDPQAEAGRRTTPGSEPVRDTAPGAGKPAGATSEPDPQAPDPQAEARRHTTSGSEPVRDTAPGAGKPAGATSEPDAEAEAGEGTAPEPQQPSEADAGHPAERREHLAEAEGRRTAEADAKRHPGTDAKRHPGAGGEPRTEGDADRRTAAEAARHADAPKVSDTPVPADATSGRTDGLSARTAEHTGGTTGPTRGTPEPTTNAPAPASGDRPPQGPPAAVDESRTGGAGGNTARAEGEAEARAAAQDGGGAGRGAGRVDQPTTTLKLPPESEAERTSRFIALKPLEAQAPPGAERTTALPRVEPDRTTQQPLPPRPPLDLLAELTNTPPPAATPLRTVVRRVKIWTPLVLLLLVVFAIVQTVRPLPAPSLELTAQDSHTFGGENGESGESGEKVDIPWPADGQAALDVQGIGSFGSSGEQEPMPIASVAKVMTAYVILRDHPLKSGEEGPMIDIDQRAEDESDAGQESTVDVTAGDQISEREAVESILIASANNVARLLARWDATSDQAFVDKMNAAAADLGMTDTTYTDPSGLNDTTVSTAVDQVKLAKTAMEQPAFREVAAMMSYDDYKGVNHSNWNQLVGYNDVVGIKTGTTTSALGNLVFAATKDIGGETRTIVGAVVRQPAGGSDNTILQGALSAGDQLMRAAQAALTAQTILKKGDVVGYVDDGLGGRTPVVVTRDVTAVGWAGLEVKVSFAPKELPRTAKAGTEVGSLTVGDGSGGGAVSVPVALQGDLAEPAWQDRLTRIG
ncbi:D-alanyl-D-alanine carboxypeptidase [Streptomyces sp. NPDC059477]|uniref:D-alanyl-D-alanine carboxypeptidase n=1 Tax=Streptomyces sp. NPDC059477 TaxID=3346847 RepID=UPI0036CD9B4B